MDEIQEADFATLLRSLGVETYGLSFGWMLNEYDPEGILRWMFTNLDSGNALTKRETCRYAELKEKELLSEDELEGAICDILGEYEGLTLPGDVQGLERAKQENAFLEERLNMLNKQERSLGTLIKQNEIAKEEVTRQISELKEQQVRGRAELEAATADSLSAAELVGRRERELFQAVAKHLNVYISCQSGEELPKQLMIAGPLETYNQKKRLFKSHLKTRVTRQLDAKRWEDSLDVKGNQQDDAAAKHAEKRLYDGIMGYVEAVADYSHTYRIVQIMSEPVEVHPSRIHAATAETLSSLEVLRQQEELAHEELRAEARALARRQTHRAVCARRAAALNQRRQIYSVMSSIHTLVLEYESLDSLLYLVLRREWRRAQDTIQFAEDVKNYLEGERANLAARIEAMSSLYQEHTECERRLQSDNLLLNTLNQLYGNQPGDSFTTLKQKVATVQSRTADLKEEIEAEFQKKEEFLHEMAVTCKPLTQIIWDGSTRQPGVYDLSLTRLLHQLRGQTAVVENKITRAVDKFTAMKSKDKDVGRKLWQWFLTDPDRLISKIEEIRRSHL